MVVGFGLQKEERARVLWFKRFAVCKFQWRCDVF